MDKAILREIIKKSRLFDSDAVNIIPFRNAEDGEEYSVWLVTFENSEGECVLKRAKGYELSIYKSYLTGLDCVPRLLGFVEHEGEGDGNDENYLFLEYIKGSALQKISRDDIKSALDALITIQSRFWQTGEVRGCGLSFEESLERRIDRGKYLNDALLEAEYERFLSSYKSLPRTLCHDDLLPFNVMVKDSGEAVIIDWEVGGILPYPVPLARFIAHTEENAAAFFYMTEADKEFAVCYYYERFIADKGISFSEYKRALDLFVFYEYCEWIMLGNKYDDADMVRFEEYKKKAMEHIKRQ